MIARINADNANKYQRKNVERQWFTITGDPREIVLVHKMSKPDSNNFDLTSVFALRKDSKPGFWRATDLPKMGIDAAVTLINRDSDLAKRGYPINTLNVFEDGERKHEAKSPYTLFAVAAPEDVPTGYNPVDGDMGAAMWQVDLILVNMGYRTQYRLVGPKAETQDLAYRRFKQKFYGCYPGCKMITPSEISEQASPEVSAELDDACMGLPSLD